MVCILCGAETHVINSRPQKRLNQVWRRRQCLGCGAVFTTEEKADYAASWLVRDRSGALAPFSRDKLLLSLYKACQHRETALSDAAGLTETVIYRLRVRHQGLIERQQLMLAVQVALNRFDKAASISYQAFHRD